MRCRRLASPSPTATGGGDLITTRLNNRKLTTLAGRDFVKNRDVWEVRRVRPDGVLDVTHTGHAGTVTLPADYVADAVELGYASTAHGAQGCTVDTSRALISDADHAAYAYVALTRGRATNEAYVIVEPLVDIDADHAAPPARDVHAVLGPVLVRDPGERSATETLREAFAAPTVTWPGSPPATTTPPSSAARPRSSPCSPSCCPPGRPRTPPSTPRSARSRTPSPPPPRPGATRRRSSRTPSPTAAGRSTTPSRSPRSSSGGPSDSSTSTRTGTDPPPHHSTVTSCSTRPPCCSAHHRRLTGLLDDYLAHMRDQWP